MRVLIDLKVVTKSIKKFRKKNKLRVPCLQIPAKITEVLPNHFYCLAFLDGSSPHGKEIYSSKMFELLEGVTELNWREQLRNLDNTENQEQLSPDEELAASSSTSYSEEEVVNM